jgi:hypothetical protein
MKTYRGSTGIAPHILNHGTRLRWVVNFTHLPLNPQGKTPVPTEWEAGWAPLLLWIFWRREKSHAPCWDSNPATHTHSFVAFMFFHHKLTSAQIRSWIPVMLHFLTLCCFNPYQSNITSNLTAVSAVTAPMSSWNLHIILQCLMLVFP